jgi:predicted nuclease with TOPRIM domain
LRQQLSNDCVQAQARDDMATRTNELQHSCHALQQVQEENRSLQAQLAHSAVTLQEGEKQLAQLAMDAARWEAEAGRLSTELDKASTQMERKEHDLHAVRQWAKVEVRTWES